MSATMLRVEWGEEMNRFYADSLLDVLAVLGDVREYEGDRITRIVWPDDDEE